MGGFASMVRTTCFLLGFGILGAAAFAQNNNGQISGTITDRSGAVIAGASIVVQSQSTKITSKTSSNADGFYVVPNLSVGSFSVAVEAPGFRKAERTGYDLVDGGRITADFKMEVGAITDTVTVTEVLGEQVNTVSGELSNT